MTRARLFGKANPNWKGGMWINSQGYVMIYARNADGTLHPMANCRSYGPRCRIVAYDHHGPPKPGQQVHHLDGDKQNDDPKNLEWVDGWDHAEHHGRPGSRITSLPLSPEKAREYGRRGGLRTSELRRLREKMEMNLLAAKLAKKQRKPSRGRKRGK